MTAMLKFFTQKNLDLLPKAPSERVRAWYVQVLLTISLTFFNVSILSTFLPFGSG